MINRLSQILRAGKRVGVGIDIGSDSIKMIQLEKTPRGIQLTNFGLAPLPEETVVEGAITNVLSVEEAIKTILQKQDFRIKKGTVVSAVSGKFVIVKKIKMPSLKYEEVKQSILWEAEQYIPFDIKDVVVDFQILKSSAGQKEMDVLLVAVKKDSLNTQIEILKRLKLSPVIIDVDSFAVANSYLVNTEDVEGVIAFINIGAAITNINILSNGEPYFTRDISIGGFDITKSIAQELKMDLEEAEKYKREREVNIPSVTSILDELVMEIQRSFDYFKSAYLNVEINRIVLSGGGAKYKNLDRILSQKLHIPITFANPFRKIQFDSVKFPPDYLQEISLLASVCTGLALRRLI